MSQVPLTTSQAQAIVAMGRGRPDYNEGVLAMLGQDALCLAWRLAERRLEQLVGQREQLTASLPFFDALAAGDAGVQGLEDARTEAAAAWAPIQALIDQARVHLETAADAAPVYGMHV